MENVMNFSNSSSTSANEANSLDGILNNEGNDMSPEVDIDAALGFGSGEGDGAGNKNTGDDVFADIKEALGQKSSDNKNAALPKNPEDLLKFFQSGYDKHKSKAEKLEQELNETKEAASFLNNLVADKELRMAFIAQLEPDLVKPKEPIAFIKESLENEFGKEFTPDKDEITIFGTKSWLYNDRANQLLQEYRTKQQTFPSSLKQYQEKKSQERAQMAKAALEEKKQILEKLKWDEATFTGFTKWVNKVKGMDLSKIYDFLLKSSKTKGPDSLSTQYGGKPINNNSYIHSLDAMFGK